MPQYIVFAVDDDEDAWETKSDADQQRETFDHDEAFGKLLAERGGKVVGGADLAHSRETRVLEARPDGRTAVTDGPYAETVEQISGFYIVECSDLATVIEAASLMAPGHTRLEIRPRPAKVAS